MEIRNSMCITRTCRTICELMGIEAPEKADNANRIVTEAAKAVLGDSKAERILLYNPDAIALWLFQKYTERFIPVIRNTTMMTPVQSVMPSVTPVNFGSMYTGLMPKDHGIQAYVKPVIKSDSLFDAAIRSGKKPIIISTRGHSLTMIYKERPMDYIECDSPDEVNEEAQKIIAADRHDIVLCYNGNFDYTMHRNGPESEKSLSELDYNANAFEKLCKACDEGWKGHNRVYAFLPDHGCHEIDGDLGSHGLDIDEDMNTLHFYGFRRKDPQ